jgi:hypothetical protein
MELEGGWKGRGGVRHEHLERALELLYVDLAVVGRVKLVEDLR